MSVRAFFPWDASVRRSGLHLRGELLLTSVQPQALTCSLPKLSWFTHLWPAAAGLLACTGCLHYVCTSGFGCLWVTQKAFGLHPKLGMLFVGCNAR